jgi:mono/diheme cytochrome c family protein
MYPIWEVPNLSAGIILALIATFHILPSHLSVGAMWFNVLIESKAYREERPELLEFIKKYTLLLLIFSYVFGSLSGVGIWFAATVANPRGISGLIHIYVWGWATEWVFFIIEVTAIFLYYYTLDKVDRKTHLTIGRIFAVASWITMIIITGILSFMLSPGLWPETGRFFDGFFNQTYWPQLAARTCFMVAIAAVYALAVATRMSNIEVRAYVTRMVSLWGAAGLVLGSVMLFWYRASLPEPAESVLGLIVPGGLKIALAASVSVLISYFLYARLRPLAVRTVPAVLAVAVLFAGIWSAERVREIIRKPYVISQYLYSNQLRAKSMPAMGGESDIDTANARGILTIAPFVPPSLRRISDANLVETGRMIALIECSSCHVLNETGLRPLPKMIQRLNIRETETAEGLLTALHGFPYMPPFSGTSEEKRALASYLTTLGSDREESWKR